MSFVGFKSQIEAGDTVILYINPHRMHAIEVKSKRLNKNSKEIDNVFQTQFGALNMDSLIGKNFGCKITLAKGWIYVLHPTCELWTQTLPHRTQIIYTPDISLILFQLDLKPGDIVLEAGTGSGSLTHALARTVSPNGHVHSFDFHETRVSIAEIEFKNHGLSVVSVRQRDVCQDGYGETMNSVADAIFLDLPLPWEAIPHARRAIKSTGGRFASFSPCIEQVQKTCTMLRDYGFTDINTCECLQREFAVVHRTMPVLSFDSVGNEEGGQKNERFVTALPPLTMPGHTGYLTFATLPPIHSRPSIRKDKPESVNTDIFGQVGLSSRKRKFQND